MGGVTPMDSVPRLSPRFNQGVLSPGMLARGDSRRESARQPRDKVSWYRRQCLFETLQQTSVAL